MKEEWRPVLGFEETHEISNLGRVRRKEHIEKRTKLIDNEMKYVDVLVKEHFYKPYLILCGYVGVSWSTDGKQINKMIHRLLAESFIENDDLENKTIVDHIDGDKLNNNLDNLRWVTPKGNSKNTIIRNTKVSVYCVEDNKTFSSISDAERFYNIPVGMVNNAIKGNMKTHGLTFQFTNVD